MSETTPRFRHGCGNPQCPESAKNCPDRTVDLTVWDTASVNIDRPRS